MTARRPIISLRHDRAAHRHDNGITLDPASLRLFIIGVPPMETAIYNARHFDLRFSPRR